MSTSPSSSKSGIVLHLPRRLLAIVGIAFAVGLLLFLVVWLVGRKDNDFYKPQPAQVQQETEQVKPLPEPLPAGSAASSMPQAKPVPADETPKLVETAPTPPPTTAAPVPAAGADAAAGSNGAAVALAPGDRPVPLEGQTPPPRYPPAALRRGDAGTVVVRVDVDASGAPAGVALLRRSGSRDLDRAAMETVRRWKFRPAQQNGRAVPASIEIPFDFKPGP
ncbi:energy transducer TonB [Xanthomonas rydalmerensis]|uniref:Energy transducer TonB n=3 Tax=Xanthomonas TaxID=338 RepID=A0ABZ0JUB9_9XANT|nr:energy transducer TonB [Xanthomonas sp. DM-2023]WOS42633.1 energy transducer TonB [Xanthomonas sp. DM-2023]WOS46819.1 energy transducer TonB [Xanthomonas sp. DM-2023]WOS50999.1 energy transducer TonB [Xanthomonas sp. DM-2023]WOS55179.1 energy transducer TonB [Xanthomonas sp. DM-2023]WOS59361.1 energy transducer TonB [Xanthomonas sp. DM-2023]